MKIAKRYVLLQRIVWFQSAFCVALALYTLVASKKQYPLNLTVAEAPSIDLSFLDFVTNQPRRAVSATALPPAPVAGGNAVAAAPLRRFPFRFDCYSVVGGIPSVVVGGSRVLREGDVIHGRRIESISPLGVVVEGEWYDYNKRKDVNDGI